MCDENKIIIGNVNKMRLLTEAVDNNQIIDAINNHEYIYLYYKGDESNSAGYRTIRPYVLGTTNKGHYVLRAWQDKGKSISNSPDSPRRRPNHEYWQDIDGKTVSGWRLFRVDRMGSIYPTGKKFNNKDGGVLIPPKYREGADDQMGGGIIAYIKTTTQDISTDKLLGRSVVKRKVSDFDVQAEKWKDFFNANQAERNITANDIQKLYDIVRKVYKKSPNNYIVFINDNNKLDLKFFKNIDDVPQNLQLGRLTNLYDRFVNKDIKTDKDMNAFVNKSKNAMKRGEKLK